jgi:hypothetical protein
MAVTIEEARKVVMELAEEDRQLLAEEIIQSRWDPQWVASWVAEAERRYARLESGEDRELTLEEFWADDED